jgi:hypothetical protein
MELRQAGHTQLLANFARFFKAKKDQGSYEVRNAVRLNPSYIIVEGCAAQVEAAIQDFCEQRVDEVTFTQAEVPRCGSASARCLQTDRHA